MIGGNNEQTGRKPLHLTQAWLKFIIHHVEDANVPSTFTIADM